jgi:hypothetical protein
MRLMKESTADKAFKAVKTQSPSNTA